MMTDETQNRICLKQLLLKVFSIVALILLSSGCIQPGWIGAPPTLKIGLVAPFEGLYRPLGYETLFAVKLALQERNVQGIAGYRVELVALNDFNNPAEAEMQAKALVADPAVLGVVGHLSTETTTVAIPIYQEAGLALSVPWTVAADLINRSKGVVGVAATMEQASARLEAFSREQNFSEVVTLTEPHLERIQAGTQALELKSDAVTAGEIILTLEREGIGLPLLGQADVGSVQLLQVARAAANDLIFVSPAPAPDDIPAALSFIDAYQQLAGFPPGPRAILAYDAAHILLDAIEQVTLKKNEPLSRAAVSRMMTSVRRRGLSGDIAFNEQGGRVDAPLWLYQISDEQYPGVLIAHD